MKKEKFRNLNSETKTSYFYGIIFLLVIIVALIVKFVPSKVVEKKNSNENIILEELIDYEKILNDISNNYELDVIVNKYYVNEYINVKKQGLNEIINIKKFNSNNTYNQDDIINEDVDMTFINPLNILKLLNVKTYSDKNKYMVETNRWLKLYNELNGTNIEKSISGEITIEFLSKENDEYKIEMNLTNLYKNLNYDYENVIYNMKFYNINKVNLSNND